MPSPCMGQPSTYSVFFEAGCINILMVTVPVPQIPLNKDFILFFKSLLILLCYGVVDMGS